MSTQILPSNPRGNNLGKFLHPQGGIPKMLAKNALTPAPKTSSPQAVKTNATPVKKQKPLSGFGIQ